MVNVPQISGILDLDTLKSLQYSKEDGYDQINVKVHLIENYFYTSALKLNDDEFKIDIDQLDYIEELV